MHIISWILLQFTSYYHICECLDLSMLNLPSSVFLRFPGKVWSSGPGESGVRRGPPAFPQGPSPPKSRHGWVRGVATIGNVIMAVAFRFHMGSPWFACCLQAKSYGKSWFSRGKTSMPHEQAISMIMLVHRGWTPCTCVYIYIYILSKDAYLSL